MGNIPKLDLEALSLKYGDDYGAFERVRNPRSKRSDLHAFLLLDEIIGDDDLDIVSGAEHNEIFLGVEAEEFARKATEQQFLELIRCGVRYDSAVDSLCLFV